MVRRLFCNATVSERSKPEMTTQPLSVGCLILNGWSRLTLRDHSRVFPACRTQRFRSSGKKLSKCVGGHGFYKTMEGKFGLTELRKDVVIDDVPLSSTALV